MSQRKAVVYANAQDQAAVTLSSLCLLHCLALPLLFSMLPPSLLWLESELIRVLLVFLAIPISGYAIFTGFGKREECLFVVAACSGLALLTLAVLVEPIPEVEYVLTTTGAVLLSVAHMSRWMRRTAALSGQHGGT